METNPLLSILSKLMSKMHLTLSKDSILSETKLKFPELLGYTKQVYWSSNTLIYTKGWFTICDGDVTDRDGQLFVVFTIRVHSVLIITIFMLPDYLVLVLCFADWLQYLIIFCCGTSTSHRAGENRIDSIRPSMLRETNLSIVRLERCL